MSKEVESKRTEPWPGVPIARVFHVGSASGGRALERAPTLQQAALALIPLVDVALKLPCSDFVDLLPSVALSQLSIDAMHSYALQYGK